MARGEIRDAKAAERTAVFLMGFDAWSEGRSVEDYLASCAASRKYASGRWRVLAEAEELLSSLIVYDLGVEAAGLGSIATPPPLRGRGHAARLVSLAAAELAARGKSRVFLFSDIAPEFYERLGFAALPERHQKKAGSCCMVRSRDLDALLKDAGFAPPEYF